MPAILLAFPLLALVALLVAYGFAQIQHGQSTGFLGWLESVAKSSLWLVSPLAVEALKLTSWLTHYLGRYFAATFHRGVQFFAGLNQYTRLVASIALTWPTELFRVSQWLVWHEIPRLLKALPSAVTTIVHQTTKVIQRIEKTVYKFPKLTKALIRAALVGLIPFPLVRMWSVIGWLIHHFRAVVHAVTHAGSIATTVPGIIWRDVTAPVGRTIAQVKKFMRRLHWLLAFTSASALVAAALTKMGLHWIRCNNVKRLGRSICGSPGWLINLLAAGVVEAFVIGDLCRFTLLLEAEVKKVKPALLELVNVENALIHCGDNHAPGRLSLPPLSLPPMPAPSAFAA